MRQSESARVTTAKEAKFRVQYPNSRPRSIKVLALDAEAGRVVRQVAQGTWQQAVFFTSVTFPAKAGATGGSPKDQMQAWLGCVAGQASDLVSEIDSADSVVVVATAGEDVEAASLVGEICQLRHKSMIGLVLHNAGASDAALSRTLLGLRPFTTMLVVATDQGYIEEMLTAMRA